MSTPSATILASVIGLGFAATPPMVSPPTSAASVAPSGQSPAAKTADPALEKRLAALDAAIAKTVDFKANFEQRKYTPLLKKPMVSKGVLTSKGGLVKWETTEPRLVTILIDPLTKESPPTGAAQPVPSPNSSNSQSETPATAPELAGEMRVYYPSDQLCEIYPIGGALIDFASAPLPRLTELRGRFTIESVAPAQLGSAADDPALLGLLLLPKTAEIRKHLESIKLLIDETIPAATKIVITDAEGERTEIALTSIRINSGLKDTDVQLTLPDGVRLSRPLGNIAPPAPTGLVPTGLTPMPKTAPPTPPTSPSRSTKDPAPPPR